MISQKEVRKWLLQSLDQAKQFCCPISILADLSTAARFEYIRYPVRLNILDTESTEDFHDDDYDVDEEDEDSEEDTDDESKKDMKSTERTFLPYEQLRTEYQKWFERTPEREMLFDKRRILMFLLRQSKRPYPVTLSADKYKSPSDVLNLLMDKKNPIEIHQTLMTFFLPEEIKNIRSFKGHPLRDFQILLSRPTLQRIVERKKQMIQFCVAYHRNFRLLRGIGDQFIRELFLKVFALPRLEKLRIEKKIMFFRNCALVFGPTLPPPLGKDKPLPTGSRYSAKKLYIICLEELGKLFVWAKHYPTALSFFDFLYFEFDTRKFEYIHHLFECYQGIVRPLDTHLPITLKGGVHDFDVLSIFEGIQCGDKYAFLLDDEEEEEEKEGEEDDEDDDEEPKEKVKKKMKKEVEEEKNIEEEIRKEDAKKMEKMEKMKKLIKFRLEDFYEKWKYQIDIEENDTTIRHVRILLTTYISVESSDFVVALDQVLDQKYVYLLYRLNDDSSLIYRLLENYEAVEIFVELRRELDRVKVDEKEAKKDVSDMKTRVERTKKAMLGVRRDILKEKRAKEKLAEENRVMAERLEHMTNSYKCCMQIIRGENHLLKYIKRHSEFVEKEEEYDSWEARWRRSVLGISTTHSAFIDAEKMTSSSPMRKRRDEKEHEDRRKLKLQFANDTEATMFQLEGAVNPYISIIIRALDIFRAEMYNIGSDRLCQNILKVTPHITELDLYASEATDKIFEFCPNLEILEIDRCDGIDGSGFSELTKLRELKIQNNNSIFNDAFQGVGECLERLSIKWMNKITIEGLKHLRNLKVLVIGLGIRVEEEDVMMGQDEINKDCKIQFLKE